MINIQEEPQTKVKLAINGNLDFREAVQIPAVTDYKGELVIPSRINGQEVTEISKMSFPTMEPIQVMRFPKSVERIGEWMFGAAPVKDVVFEGPIRVIPAHAFTSCRNLTSVTIQGRNIGSTSKQTGSEGVPLVIGESAFEQCPGLKSLVLTNAILSAAAFQTSGLRKVTLRWIACIPAKCFFMCSDLKEADIQGTVTLEYAAFQFCSGLTDLHVSDELYSLSNLAFIGCNSLKRVHLHKVKNPGRIRRILQPALKSKPEYVIEE